LGKVVGVGVAVALLAVLQKAVWDISELQVSVFVTCRNLGRVTG